MTKSDKHWQVVKELVDTKQIVLSTDEEGIVIGSDKWVYSCQVCNTKIGKNSDSIYTHFFKDHPEVMAMLGLASL